MNDNSLDNAKTFSQTGGDKTVQDVISKLRFISKIQPNDKVNVKSLFVRNNEQIWQRFLRTLRSLSYEDGENKKSTFAFIETVTDAAINLICIYKKDPENSFNISIADLTISNLEASLHGMQSLLETYKSDINFTSNLEAFMGTLNLRINTLQRNGLIVDNDV